MRVRLPEGASRATRPRAPRETIRCPTCGSHRLVHEIAFIGGAKYLCNDCGFRGAFVVTGMDAGSGPGAERGAKPRAKVMVVPLRMGREWEVLVLRRGPNKGSVWAPVTGNVDKGESPRAAAERELAEETGLAAYAAIHPTGFVNRFSKPVKGETADFAEEVFAAVVRPGAAFRISREHVEARWVGADEAVRLVEFEGCKEGVRRALAAVEPRGA